MNAMKFIAGMAIVCMTSGAYAQSCQGHAGAHVDGSNDGMAMVTKELDLNAEQQAEFTKALASCQKDCSAMANTGGDEMMMEKKQARFNEVVASMKSVLKPDQQKKLEQMNSDGKLKGLCAADGKGCCAGAKAGKSCCAGKTGASTERAPKAQPNAAESPKL